jgi:hypothetical protein
MSIEEPENVTANEDLAVPGEEAESVIGGATSTSKPAIGWNMMENEVL